MMTPRSQPTAFGPALLTVGHAGALFGPLDGIPTTLSPGGGDLRFVFTFDGQPFTFDGQPYTFGVL